MLLYGWLSVCVPAFAAGESEEAEIEFQLGLEAYSAGEYNLALSRFLASNRLAPNPAVAYNIARCYAKTERYAESYRWYTVAAQSLDTEDARKAVQTGLDAVIPKVVVYDITTDPPGASVYVDSKDYGVIGTTPLKLALDPSSSGRTFIFTKEGHEDALTLEMRGERGQTIGVQTQLKPVVGTAAIRGADGANVHLGTPTGPVLCVAPCEAELPPGYRVLYVRREGFRDAVLQLDIQANQRTEAEAALIPNTGSILVQSSERGSLVEIDGVAAGFTPTVVRSVPVGERVVRVSQPGFLPFEQTVTVENDQQIELGDIKLAPSEAVTAVSRRAEQASLAPSSVTLITRAEIEAFRYPTIYEALRGVRGFAMTQDSVYGVATVRGFGEQNDFNNKMLLLKDGVPLNDLYGGAAFLTYDAMIDTDIIEQLEIVRGPGSVLYGTGAVSGVINIVDPPRSKKDGVTIRGGGFDRNFFGTGRVEKDFSDAFGVRAELSGGASQGRTETIDPLGPTEPITVTGVERFEGATTSGRMWFGKQATMQWFYTLRKQYIPTGAYTTNFGLSPRNYWTDQRGTTEMRYEPKLSEKTSLFARAYASYSRYDGSFPINSYTLFETFTGVLSGAEVRLISEPVKGFRMQVGSTGNLYPSLTMTGNYIPKVGEPEPYLDESGTIWTASAFGVFDIEPSKLLALSLGVRGDYWSTFGFAPSPRASLVLRPTDRDVVKLLFGRAFRAPSYFELYYSAPDVIARSDYDGNILQPEVVWSAETEYSHRFGELWTVLLAGHGSLADNLIETVPIEGEELIVTANSDERIQTMGADIEIRRSFQSGILASAFYSYLDSRYEGGEDLPNVPRHHTSGKVVFPISAPELKMAVRTSLEGTRRINLNSDERTPLALIADLVLSGEIPSLELEYAFGVYNALDMQYIQPVGDTLPLRTIPQPGRSILFNVSKMF